jgi:S1-C subfamily serine protease
MAEPKGRLSREVRKFTDIVSDMRHVVFSVIRDRPQPDGGVASAALGTGFFLKGDTFITCDHVMNSTGDPHQVGDSYRLIANLTGSTATVHVVKKPDVGKELSLYPDLDLAILQVPEVDDQPFASISYAEVPIGEEIGIVGYPLASLTTDAKANLQLEGLIYRAGKGIVTGRYRGTLNPVAPDLPMLETNFMFVSGNSGGPVFSAETGNVIGMVQGYRTVKVGEHLMQVTSPKNPNLPTEYYSAVQAVYSGGIKCDAFRTALESFSIVP